MPYALRNKETAELFSCALVNLYGIPYHGVKLWEDRSEAEADAPSFLAERGVDDPARWEVVGLDEHQAKLCNVRLGNNPKKRVYLAEDGTIDAQWDAT